MQKMVTGLPGSGYRDAGYRLKNQLQVTCCKLQGTNARELNYLPDLRLSKPWNLEPEIWNLQPETWNLQPATWNLQPET